MFIAARLTPASASRTAPARSMGRILPKSHGLPLPRRGFSLVVSTGSFDEARLLLARGYRRPVAAPRLLLLLRRMILATNRGNVHLRRRQLQIHVFQGVGDDCGDSEIAEPLVVGRDYKPRGMLGARPFHGFLERRDIVRPQLALRIVGLADFPMARRIVKPPLEALELLGGADMKIELENTRTARGEYPLEVIDQLIAFRPHRPRHHLVY